MKEIPLRKIITSRKEPLFSESFSIRNVADLLSGTDMVQELHRHDFFFILALEKAKGDHEIDFTRHEVSDRSVFFMGPGQVHHLKLKAGSTGYLIGFQDDFYNLMTKYQGAIREQVKGSAASIAASWQFINPYRHISRYTGAGGFRCDQS